MLGLDEPVDLLPLLFGRRVKWGVEPSRVEVLVEVREVVRVGTVVEDDPVADVLGVRFFSPPDPDVPQGPGRGSSLEETVLYTWKGKGSD